MISSGAYARLDIGSEANTGNATRLGSSMLGSRSLRKGLPTTNRFAAVVNLDTPESSFEALASLTTLWHTVHQDDSRPGRLAPGTTRDNTSNTRRPTVARGHQGVRACRCL